MRCIAANRSILTAIDQNTTLADHDQINYTAITNDIDNKDTIQFADGWYSYPDLNTFDSDLLLGVLTLRNIKPTKIISPWNNKAENSTTLPLTEIATRQLEALFNLSQLLFGLARSEQSNYTFRDLQLGQSARLFREAGFKKFPNKTRSIDFFIVFQQVVNDIYKSGAIDIVLMMYKDPRLRCVKQKSIDFLTNVVTINEIGCFILNYHTDILIQLIQGIRDGHLIEEKIPSLSLLLRLCKIILEKNLLNYYQYLIDMQFIDILIDIFQKKDYKTKDYLIYFIKFESFALQCLQILLQSPEYVDMWSEKAQISLVNYCCTLLYKSVLDDDNPHMNHIIYAEEHRINHSLNFGILTFLNIVRCRKEIGKFYRENEHFRDLISVMKEKYDSKKDFLTHDSSISNALNQVIHVMFDRHQRKKRKQYRKCSNSLCQMMENDQIHFQTCPYCHELSYCSQYCREVHWTLNHNLTCQKQNKEQSTIFYTEQNNKTTSLIQQTAFETLPVQISEPIMEVTAEITRDLCYPTTTATATGISSASSESKKKSFKTLLSLLRVNGKRR